MYTKSKEMLTKMENLVLLIVNINKPQQNIIWSVYNWQNTPLN